MATWSDEETYKLIEIWGEDNIQAMLEGCRRNKEIFVKISQACLKDVEETRKYL